MYSKSLSSQIAEVLPRFSEENTSLQRTQVLNLVQFTHSRYEVMKEIGIDISHHVSKQIEMKTFISSNAIIKLCEQANERCPIVPFGIMNVQRDITDPLTQGGTIEEVRKARDEIKIKVMELLRGLNAP